MGRIFRRFRQEFREQPALSSVILTSPLWLFLILVLVALSLQNTGAGTAPAPAAVAVAGDATTTYGTSTPATVPPLYFVSGDQYGVKCPADARVNWDVAVIALSWTPPSPDIGPAEIERNFEENCARDMKIYNYFVKQHMKPAGNGLYTIQ